MDRRPSSLLRFVGWMVLAVLAAAALQLLANLDVYESRWGLYARMPHTLFWFLAALLMATVFSMLMARGYKALRAKRSFLYGMMSPALALLLDPYLLAALGWGKAAAYGEILHTAQLLLLVGPLVHGTDRRTMPLGYAAAALIGTLLPRYAGLPTLPLELEQGALAPIHYLVLLRDMLLWTVLIVTLRPVVTWLLTKSAKP